MFADSEVAGSKAIKYWPGEIHQQVMDRTGCDRVDATGIAEVEGHPAMFFMAEAGNAEIVKIWASYGADVNCTHRRMPLLAFAVCLCESFRRDMPMVVKTLLSLGASVDAVPRAFYVPLHRDLPDDGPSEEELTDLQDANKAWCVPANRQRITRALNFSYTVRFLTYLAMPVRQPLVLLFAGPSGHGKTELAQNLGQLLSLDLQKVDCTHLRHETDLFGPWSPYRGSNKGSTVNNFLAGQNGKRCIVFLDEFEKTTDEVRRALLIPFQSGEYRDRRNLSEVDCSKAIWVLATNAFDQTILDFCKDNQYILSGENGTKESEATVKMLGRKLCKTIQKRCIGVFGAAVADKYLAELGRDLAKPIDTCDDATTYRPVGNVDLQVRRGYSVCKALAAQGYVQELGARSIIGTVDREVRMPLVDAYLAAREEIREDQPAGRFGLGVDDAGEVEVSQFAAR
ncbi:hypothetical protein VTK56DRAFT_489 [Thermocarpiscus australiensis]